MMSGGTLPPVARCPLVPLPRAPGGYASTPSVGGRDRAGVVDVEGPADDHPLDLVGALEDLHDLGLAHVALDREVAGVAVAAEDLDGVGGHLHGVVGGDELGYGGLAA